MDFAEFGKYEAKEIFEKFEQCCDKLYPVVLTWDNSSKCTAVFADDDASPYYDDSGNDSVIQLSEYDAWGDSFVMQRVIGKQYLKPSIDFAQDMDQFELPILNTNMLSSEKRPEGNQLTAMGLCVTGHKIKIASNFNSEVRNTIEESGSIIEVLSINKSSNIFEENDNTFSPETVLKDEIISSLMSKDVWPMVVKIVEPLIRSISELNN